ncbi:hypothetical protein Lsai_1340 [Legionella sainthelensi]|uniref:Uncharacterized protein n=1 Tax=Legionella sainthelensi TaxID=28087 RepID=A0A0W0YPD3_9GAMM|nr:hypothetical protein [Legionella sainthelensi]KTD58733.1 hypothetical protein Lsai_1340 [Legionella sainthelensi]VEH34718.1 Uncharacterised protein [Legionella sainthelensi]
MAKFDEIHSVNENFKDIKSIFDYALSRKWISRHAYDLFVSRIMNQKFFLPGEFTAGAAIIFACMNTELANLSIDELVCIISNTAGNLVKELKSEPDFTLLLSQQLSRIYLVKKGFNSTTAVEPENESICSKSGIVS